jgi:hypothetical protein
LPEAHASHLVCLIQSKLWHAFSSFVNPSTQRWIKIVMTRHPCHHIQSHQMLDIGYEEFLPFFDGFSEGLLIVDSVRYDYLLQCRHGRH